MSGLESEKIWLKGILIACPMGRPVANCPVQTLRTLPVPERLQAVEDMELHRARVLLGRHNDCLQQREML